MSKKKTKKISPTIGLQHWAEVGPEIGVSVRVTGRNLGALTYIASLEAERMKRPHKLTVEFAEDGHLVQVEFNDGKGFNQIIRPGDVISLPHGAVEAMPWAVYGDYTHVEV